MKYKVSLLFFLVIALVGCTTMPSRFTDSKNIYPDSGYRVEARAADGFDLEVCILSYSFFPSPDESVQKGRECYRKVAQELAVKDGKQIQPISITDMSVNANRNSLEGKYTVYVTGRVKYAAN